MTTPQTKSSRTYKQGRDTTGWRKGERVKSLGRIRPGDVLIMDSRQFKATNLIKVTAMERPTEGFDYQYMKPDGEVILQPVMFANCFDLETEHRAFYHAERV